MSEPAGDAPGQDVGQVVLLVTPREAARRLSIGSRKLWELTNTGELAVVRVGRVLRYRPCDLEDWVARQVSRRGRPAGG